MRHLLTVALVATTLITPLAALAQQAPPTADQIARALSRPAAPQLAAPQFTAPLGPIGGEPLQVTATMLKGPTRGIIPAQPTTPRVASAPAAASAATPCPAGSGVCALNIEFETGSASLTTDAQTTLDNLGKALASLQGSGFRFRVEGHTDTVGADAYNRTLSEERADTVTAYLAEHYAIDRGHLQPIGMGKDHPLVQTPDQTPEPRNRRVQVINLGA
ncbi:MAG: OmpA family protein [Acetobacteraceae bacterium]|nr:OmpA family protein [Acetobacteraceae bacterium]